MIFTLSGNEIRLHYSSGKKNTCHRGQHVAHLRQQCHNSKFVLFQEKLLKDLKCYNFI